MAKELKQKSQNILIRMRAAISAFRLRAHRLFARLHIRKTLAQPLKKIVLPLLLCFIISAVMITAGSALVFLMLKLALTILLAAIPAATLFSSFGVSLLFLGAAGFLGPMLVLAPIALLALVPTTIFFRFQDAKNNSGIKPKPGAKNFAKALLKMSVMFFLMCFIPSVFFGVAAVLGPLMLSIAPATMLTGSLASLFLPLFLGALVLGVLPSTLFLTYSFKKGTSSKEMPTGEDEPIIDTPIPSSNFLKKKKKRLDEFNSKKSRKNKPKQMKHKMLKSFRGSQELDSSDSIEHVKSKNNKPRKLKKKKHKRNKSALRDSMKWPS